MRISVQIEFDKILDLNTKKTSVIIGRAKDVADLVIPHSSISRRHCKLELIENEFYITDLKSSNGIIINGTKIPPMVKTKIPADASIKIATLDCDISNKTSQLDTSKIESQEINHDFTSTIRIARIDLEKDIIETRKITKSPPRVKGPRNPITHRPAPQKEKSKGFLRSLLFYFLVTSVVLLALILYRSIKNL